MTFFQKMSFVSSQNVYGKNHRVQYIFNRTQPTKIQLNEI
jgi:hypothetical protein